MEKTKVGLLVAEELLNMVYQTDQMPSMKRIDRMIEENITTSVTASEAIQHILEYYICK